MLPPTDSPCTAQPPPHLPHPLHSSVMIRLQMRVPTVVVEMGWNCGGGEVLTLARRQGRPRQDCASFLRCSPSFPTSAKHEADSGPLAAASRAVRRGPQCARPAPSPWKHNAASCAQPSARQDSSSRQWAAKGCCCRRSSRRAAAAAGDDALTSSPPPPCVNSACDAGACGRLLQQDDESSSSSTGSARVSGGRR